MELTTFFQQLINGLQLGAIYALIALGYTMVYGIIRLINFAHADFLMVGAFAVYFFASFIFTLTNLIPPVIVFILCLFVSLVAGAFIAELSNRLAYKPLRYKPRLSALITAVGVSMFLEYFFASLPFIGPSFRAFPDILNHVSFVVGGVYLNNIQLLDIGLAIVLMIALTYIVNRTMMGKAMRAVSQDKDAAKLMGIDVERTITFVFLIGGALAGAAGILMAMTYPRIYPNMGILPGLKAFVAAVLGGIGNIPGAMLGGFLLGIAEIYATSFNSLLGEGIAFAILIVVLLVRPQGLLGEKQSEKV